MKRNLLILVTVLLPCLKLSAQEIISEIYEGHMNGKMPITLYLQAEEHPCVEATIYNGMYKHNGVNSWLQLKITTNGDMQFILVEHDFTGVMILNKDNNKLEGVWISPDSKKQLKIVLEKVEISTTETEKYADEFETVNHQNNDC